MTTLFPSLRPSLLALVASVVSAGAVSALEVRFHPADTVYVYDERGEGSPRDLYTAVVQNLAVVNDGQQPVVLERIVLDAVDAEGALVLSTVVGPAQLERAAQGMRRYADAGMLELLDFQFQTSRYLKGVALASGRTLEPGQALVVARRAFLFQGLPSRLLVRAEGTSGDAAVTASGALTVVDHQSPNPYSFPVRGRWMAIGPSLHSHHRWGTIQEFALDLLQTGADTRSHQGDGSQLAQFYAYGQLVSSIGDGVVVAAADGMEESDANLQQPGESDEAYMQRSGAAQQALLMQGFDKIMGNHVIIEHPGGEFSVYAHLKTGSVKVKKGDVVTRRQPIGALGHSGNSTEPHLHFHVLDGPDMAYSRSLPVSFTDLRFWPAGDGTLRHVQSGQVIETVD